MAAPELLHWQRLHEAANEARDRVRKAYLLMDEIDREPNFLAMTNIGSAARLRLRRLPISIN